MNFIIYTYLFTKKGTELVNNHYIFIYLTWLYTLNKNRVIESNDYVLVFIDQPTCDFLFKLNLHTFILKQLGFILKYIIIDQPNSVLNGFFERYNPDNLNKILDLANDKTIIIHSDIDNIFQKPLRTLPWQLQQSLPTSILYLLEEQSSIFDEYHLGVYTPKMENIEIFRQMKENISIEQVGWTAGLFAYTKSDTIIDFFRNTYADRIQVDEKADVHNMSEQAAFNFNILKEFYLDKILINPYVFVMDENVSYNKFNNNMHIVSLNGEPGNSNSHMEKIIKYFMELLTI